MTALPAEPIVCLDDLSQEAAECAVPSAEDCIIQCYASEDAVVAFLAKEGRERDFMRALLKCYRQAHSYTIHEVGDFACTAFVLDTADPDSQVDAPRCQGVRDMEAVKTLVEAEEVGFLTSLGMSTYEADVLMNTKPSRVQALKHLMEDMPQRLHAYTKEHGPVFYLHFMGCCPPARERGRVQQVLDHLAAISDANARPIYTEVAGEDRKGVYAAAGYGEVDSWQLPGGGPVLSFMVRQPRDGGGGAAAAEPHHQET